MEKKESTLPFLRDLHTIFVDTNIDTHLAMVVSLHDTVSDVKAKIRAEHALCFQDIGEISIRTMKVKRRGFFYDLADSMCVWNVFNGIKGSWFVCIDAVPSPVKSPEIVAKKATHDHADHYFNEGLAISPCEPEKKLDPVMSRDHEGRAEVLIDQIETSNGMPGTCTHKTISEKRCKTSQQVDFLGSQSQHYLVENKSVKKVDTLHEDYLKDYQGRKFSINETIDEHLEDGRRGSKTEILTAFLEGLSSKLPHENIPLQNSPVEKHMQRKMKSSKRHKAHLSMPYETQSPQVTVDPHNSGKEADASICLEKCPIGPIINLLLPNDGRDIRMEPGTANSFEVTNQKIKDGHSMETCMAVISSASKKPIEDQILQFNSEDQREKYVNLGQETNGDVRLKKPEEIRIPLQLPSEFPSNSYCSTDKLMSRSNKVLEPKEANDQQGREIDDAKCMIQLNPIEDEVRPVDEAGISALTEKFSYDELATSAVSKNFSDDKHQGLDNEIVAAASLKGVNKDRSLMRVDFKVRHKSRVKKKLKTKSSRDCESTDINGYQEHFSPDGAQVCWNDVHNESNAFKIIKPADQKANGGHCVDAMIKISSSSMEDSNQNQVSHVNSGYPPIRMLHNLSEVSNLHAEEAPENIITSNPAFKVQAMPCCSRKKSKCESSKLGSPEVSDVALSKSNKEITGSNVGGGSDPSKLANGSNQKIEQHCIDSKLSDSVSDEDSSKLAKIPQMNLLDPSSCKKKDLCEQSNAKVIIKGVETNILSHGALTGSTKYKCGRKKSKKEVLNAQVSSEMSEHMELCGHDDASINFSDYFVYGESKHVLTVHTPTDLVHSVSHKIHVVEGRPQKGDNSHHSAVVAAHDPTMKDSTPGNEDKDKSSNQSRKQNFLSRTESNLSLPEADEYQKLVKKPQDYGPQTHFQLLKQDGLGSKQEKIAKDGKEETLSLPLDCGIGNMVSNDEYVQYKNFNSLTRSNNFYVSPSEGMTNQVASTDSTENTPYHLRRFRVARKIPIRRSKRLTQNSNR